MKIFLNKVSINGIKNIDRTIDLLFSNKTINRKMEYSNSNIKAIYGPNGSGKTGIVSALYIYKRLIDGMYGLNDEFFSNFICETINKNTKKFSISLIYSFSDFNSDNKVLCYKHDIEISLLDSVPVITKEQVSLIRGKTIDDSLETLVLIENGTIKELKMDNKNCKINENPLYLNSLNLLDKQSITRIFLNTYLKSKKELSALEEVSNALSVIIFLTNNMIVEMNKEDIHYDYMTYKITQNIYNSEEKIDYLLRNGISAKEYLLTISNYNRDIVKVENYPQYEENVKKLTDFIKIFKPDLDEIVIDKKINDDYFYCEKNFRYGNKQINIEFESTGIRKLTKLYYVLHSCANGAIAFIDEMDANLHDVYFTKLIEFFKNDAKGQLCFTTHNLEPIDILKKNSHSLDFLSNDSRIYSWVKDGNQSPMKKYVNGLIPYSPFNVESFDFDILLGEE